MASIWNHRISLSLFGEAEGPAIGVVLDNIPPGEYVDIEEINIKDTMTELNFYEYLIDTYPICDHLRYYDVPMAPCK